MPLTIRTTQPADRDRSARTGPDDRPDHRPPLSITTEREHVVFTEVPAHEREQLSTVAFSGTRPSVLETDGSPLWPATDDLLLGQPKHLADLLPCRVQDANLWFAESPGELDRAKAFCGDCPARRACLAGAVARREPWGVWGGEIFDHGAVIGRKRPRGRPRKHEVAA